MDSAPTSEAAPFDMFPSFNPPVLPVEAEEEESSKVEEPFGFTMEDVCLELEELRSQMNGAGTAGTSSRTTRNRKSTGRAKKTKKTASHSLRNQTIISELSKLDLSGENGAFELWNFFNRELDFVVFVREMEETSDEKMRALACEEIGLRIVHHKKKFEETSNPVHNFYKNSLNSFKSELNRSKSLVVLYVLQKLHHNDILALERRLFPVPTKLYYSIH